MRSLMFRVVCRMLELFPEACPNAHIWAVETVNSHFEGMKPLFDEIAVDVVNLSIQVWSWECSPIAEPIDEKHGVKVTASLTKNGEGRNRWVKAMLTKYIDIKTQLCFDIYCDIQPWRFFDFDSSFVNSALDRFGVRLRFQNSRFKTRFLKCLSGRFLVEHRCLNQRTPHSQSDSISQCRKIELYTELNQ